MICYFSIDINTTFDEPFFYVFFFLLSNNTVIMSIHKYENKTKNADDLKYFELNKDRKNKFKIISRLGNINTKNLCKVQNTSIYSNCY